MTRETRIGLLVGLVFIVMFGLVLSGLTEKPPLTASQNVAVDNKNPYPSQMLPEFDGTNPPAAVAPAPPAGASRTSDLPAPAPADSGPPPVVMVSIAPPPHDPVDPPVARMGMSVAPPSGPPLPELGPGQTDPVAVADPPSVTTSGGGIVYIVEDKDSFIKIARKYYGADREREYKKIMDANKDTVKDPGALRPGMKIIVPQLPGAPAATPAVSPSTPPGRPVTPAIRVTLTGRADAALAGGATTAPAAPGRSYVVQRGDTVSRIARKFLKDDSKASIDKILKANNIDAPEKLQAGAKLEIPA